MNITQESELLRGKYSRRRAIKCKILERSKSSPRYYKYLVTVAEKDGTITEHPVYGKDMQNALARLMNQERTGVLERKVLGNPFIFFLTWLAIMGWPVLILDVSSSPWYVGYIFLGVIVLLGAGVSWENYIKKGE